VWKGKVPRNSITYDHDIWGFSVADGRKLGRILGRHEGCGCLKKEIVYLNTGLLGEKERGRGRRRREQDDQPDKEMAKNEKVDLARAVPGEFQSNYCLSRNV